MERPSDNSNKRSTHARANPLVHTPTLAPARERYETQQEEQDEKDNGEPQDNTAARMDDNDNAIRR